ncbi:receptor-like protein EIX2 [Cajanus cajan]|uniref:receptor-like protein EIX2 n=1 Tax=Cajanus cajan TaxID=3821 RepID=UPI0010FBB2EB|nr:receptor-like protein EIX2 [Cajanus cajan]
MTSMIMNSSIIFTLCYLWLLTLRFGVCREIVCIPREREALLKLKHNLQQEAYEKAYEAYMRSMFGGEINPCLVDLKHLNYLDLSGNELLGAGIPIPGFLWTMTSLTRLDLSYVGFNGKIPPQIKNLSNLVYLDLTYVAIGPIPSQIGNLSNLLYLHLTSRSNKGDLFSENVDWLSSLSKLEYLDLSGVDLSKSFHWLHNLQALPSLKHLHLSNSKLNHNNQPSFLNVSSLLTLDLSFASYSPAISFVPKWIFSLKTLNSLQLRGNEIQGPIPDSFQNLTLLQHLNLWSNSFSSSIPNWLYRLCHLEFLNLAQNNLHGSISDNLGNLTSLVVLYLSYNQLEGPIPSSIGNLTSLVELDLSNNQLQGTIPTSLGNLCKLREIYFSYLKLNQQVNEILQILTPCISHGLKTLAIQSSQLSGNLTDQLGDFENIVGLDLSENSIGGALPRSIEKLSSLKSLHLSKNKFRGNAFESLRSLFNLSYLYIDDNLFQGVVNEDHLANFISLKIFSASGNNFTLNVSPNWHPNFLLTNLGMGSWQLGPNFPSWIQSQNKIEYLDLSNAGILDPIPAWFWERFSQAFVVNLSHNHIHGELATTLRNPISIYNVYLSSNNLFGKLPNLSNDVYRLDLSKNSFSESMNDFLCKNQVEPMQLGFLNLASNNLSGEIPDCWMIWPFLVDVNLQSNHFVGNLPPSMGSLTILQSLQIRNNSLSGMFPTNLRKNNQLISLDLGENNLSGTIPTWVGEKLSRMKILRLQSNKFSGHIPNEMCNMSLLQVLYLAHNDLSGNIPSCFNHLKAMTLMNKSTTPLIFSEATNYAFGSNTIGIVSVLLWLKGRGDEYQNFLGLVTSIDISNNKLSGDIPIEITNLNGLNFLNLSHNQLTGHIPSSIGNMGSLQFIDISRNQLSGEIPPTISNLSFLSMLDLSYNHLKGKIPTGTQIQSFEASNFVGNNLCGPPLPVNCRSNPQIPNIDHIGTEDDGHGVNWFFVSMTLGFVVGFWVVVAPLFIYRSWRFVYFCFLDDIWYKLQSYW